jgi:hypothetical protein
MKEAQTRRELTISDLLQICREKLYGELSSKDVPLRILIGHSNMNAIMNAVEIFDLRLCVGYHWLFISCHSEFLRGCSEEGKYMKAIGPHRYRPEQPVASTTKSAFDADDTCLPVRQILTVRNPDPPAE